MQESEQQIWKCHRTDELVVNMYFPNEMEKLWEALPPLSPPKTGKGARNFEFEKFNYS